MRVGRIPYINCYPVYGAIDRGIVPMSAELIDGVPTALNHEMKLGTLRGRPLRRLPEHRIPALDRGIARLDRLVHVARAIPQQALPEQTEALPPTVAVPA
jgi:hypothetical protein